MAKRFIGNVKGVGVSDFSWEYYLSSSSAVLDGGSWSATPPTLGNNKYLWMRSKVTLTDGSIQYTVPVCEGVWEEIYGIYAIGDKVDGALSDVTDLKSRMAAEEKKVQPLNKGGTGKTTRAAAMNYMQYIPASDLSFLTGCGGGDITANWVKAGTGLAYISTEGLLENQPMKCGWLYNFTSGSVIVAQQFIGLDGNSPVYYRSGNAGGWYPGSKGWVRSLDEKSGVAIVSDVTTTSGNRTLRAVKYGNGDIEQYMWASNVSMTFAANGNKFIDYVTFNTLESFTEPEKIVIYASCISNAGIAFLYANKFENDNKKAICYFECPAAGARTIEHLTIYAKGRWK